MSNVEFETNNTKNHVILQLFYFRIQQTNVIYISNAEVVEWMWVFPCWGFGSLIQFHLQIFPLQNNVTILRCWQIQGNRNQQVWIVANCEKLKGWGNVTVFHSTGTRHTALLVLRKNRSPEISMHQNKQLIYTKKYFFNIVLCFMK